MHNLRTGLSASSRDDSLVGRHIDQPGYAALKQINTPTRVIEVGAVTAGIAVPEARGVRFFSSSRAFDRLDGTVFRSTEQAARAARALGRATPQGGGGRLQTG